MAKRSFGFDTTSLATSQPLLEDGLYAGVICNAAVSGKEDKQYIKLDKEVKWNKDRKEMEETGEYTIQGLLMYGAILTSEKAKKNLQVDEPRVFGGMIRLEFDNDPKSENYLRLKQNHVLGQLLHATGLNEIDFSETVDFDYDEDIEVPEEFLNVPDIIDKLNSIVYQRALFGQIVNSLNGVNVKVKVVKRPNRQNQEVMENVIDMGTFGAPFCGVLVYEEGCEQDLEG